MYAIRITGINAKKQKHEKKLQFVETISSPRNHDTKQHGRATVYGGRGPAKNYNKKQRMHNSVGALT